MTRFGLDTLVAAFRATFGPGGPTFWEPLDALRDGRITREAAVAEIARRYRRWVDIFERAKAAARAPDGALAKLQQG